MLMCVQALHAQDFWQPVLPSAAVIKLASNSQGHIFATSDSGVYRSTDGGTIWVQVNSGLPFPSLALAINPLNDELFVASGSRIYRSTNNGESWVLQNSTTFPFGVWRLALNNQGTLFAGGNSGGDSLRRSTDNGITWTIMSNGLPPGIQDIQIHSNSDLYVGIKNNWVFRSTDNGYNWSALVNPGPSPDADAIAFGTSELYVGDDGRGFFKSTDGGSSWAQLNSGLPTDAYGAVYVWALAVSSEGHLFAGLPRDGIYRSTNDGAQWDSINTGLDSLSRRIYALLIAPSGHIFAGTTHGLYRSTQAVTHVGDDLNNLVTQYSLFQNYPNPFNPSTVIRYAVHYHSKIILKVYDLLGQEVTTLQNGFKQAGTYEVEWNTGTLPSGMYFYRLQADEFSETKKLMLLR
ncbi:MAG: T9SS type A sorting domain-containing protein [Bacteroidetes bacterium]|nr:T9SS type A sorting domain-containing protein [Bacteroidota bacterium]